MEYVYQWLGFGVFWLVTGALCWFCLYIIPWRFLGYVVGWFRMAKMLGSSPWRWRLFRWAWRRTIEFSDGWYSDIGEHKVPYYGFEKMVPKDSWPA